MDCMQIKNRLVQYLEGLLTKDEKALIDSHLEECNECRKKITSIMDIQDRLVLSNRQNRSDDFENKVLNRIIREQNRRLKETFNTNPWSENWRSMMKSRITRLGAATAVVFAVIITIALLDKTEPIATAQDVLSDAVKVTAGLESIHIRGQIRSSTDSYISNFDLNYDFMPIEVWKKVDQEGKPKWRIEKTGFFVITDGKTATIFNAQKNSVYKYDEHGRPNFNNWVMRLLDVHEALETELKQAKNNPLQQIRLTHKKIGGKDKIILEVNTQTQAPPGGNPYENKILVASNSIKVYQFDTDTKLLEGLKIFIIDNGQEVLVFETADIEYNTRIDDSVFIPNLPYNVNWVSSGPQILSDNDEYAEMTPKEVAAAFLDAASKEDWDEMLKFWTAGGINQKDKDYLAHLEVISLGEPIQYQFKSGSIWIVSYKIKLKNGDIREDKLSLSNDNPAKRYAVFGDF